MAEGHFARHIQRMRKLYAERRAAAKAGLEKVLGPHVRIDTPPGGMHLILRLQGQRSDRELVARMRKQGLYTEALADWNIAGAEGPALLLNFTNIDSAAQPKSWRGACSRCCDHDPVWKTIYGPSALGQDAARWSPFQPTRISS